MEKKIRRISRIELFSLLLMAPSSGINWPDLLGHLQKDRFIPLAHAELNFLG
jgi:hypothetical protein